MVVVSINNGLLLFRSEVDAPVHHGQCEPTQAKCKAYHQMEGLHCSSHGWSMCVDSRKYGLDKRVGLAIAAERWRADLEIVAVDVLADEMSAFNPILQLLRP